MRKKKTAFEAFFYIFSLGAPVSYASTQAVRVENTFNPIFINGIAAVIEVGNVQSLAFAKLLNRALEKQ